LLHPISALARRQASVPFSLLLRHYAFLVGSAASLKLGISKSSTLAALLLDLVRRTALPVSCYSWRCGAPKMLSPQGRGRHTWPVPHAGVRPVSHECLPARPTLASSHALNRPQQHLLSKFAFHLGLTAYFSLVVIICGEIAQMFLFLLCHITANRSSTLRGTAVHVRILHAPVSLKHDTVGSSPVYSRILPEAESSALVHVM
jgi:hypothetical protein